ncbi:MAG: hypothetical protein FJ265_12585 [Planctomycetes bacterium]|nr:hypothetical protein [Planctomycetota bacterium]
MDGTPRTGMQKAGIVVLLLAAVAAAATALVTMGGPGDRAPRTGARYIEQALAGNPVDPSRIGWDETATWTVAMPAPLGLCVLDGGRIAVAGDRVELFAEDGRPVLRSGQLPSAYRAITGAGPGRAFAAASTRVDVLDLTGSEVKVLASLDLAERNVRLDAIARAEHGLFVADAIGRKVWRLLLRDDGSFDPAATPVEFVEGLAVPSTVDLAVAPGGELVTVDPGRFTVQRRDGYGDVVAAFGGHGGGIAEFPGCCNPMAVAVFADGCTVTAEKGLTTTRVKVFDAAGRLRNVVADRDRFDVLPDGPPILLDVAVDARGRVLVLDPHRRQVRVFTERERRK